MGIVEAPNTTSTSGIQDCAIKLKNYFNAMGLAHFEVCMGYISSGQQELAIAFDSTKVSIAHKPGGSSTSKSNPRFNGQLWFDTDDDSIDEVYTMYRPPLEAEVTVLASQQKFRLMLVHAKSKVVYNPTDRVHFDRESLSNRRKLFAECTWIRRRVDEWLDDGHNVAVMGDINDGPGMDFYEATFGKSGVEIIMGDIFRPDYILKHPGGRGKWGTYGWEPSTTNFTDPYTDRTINAQIDHILASAGLPLVSGSYRIWNPSELDEAKPISAALKDASDHYPVTLDLNM